MQRFVNFTLQQKVVFNLLFVLLMVIGAFTLLRMPVERYPNIQFGKMYILTYLPGASPEDIETLITREIEEALEDLDEVEYIRSSSYRERSNIVIKFEDDSDYEKRFDDVRLKVLSIVDDLPQRAEPPVFNFLDVNDWFPTISVNVAGRHSNTTLTQVAETLEIPLAQIDGVREVRISGDFDREFHLILSHEKLRGRGMSFAEVAKALRATQGAFPAGHTETPIDEFVVRVDEQFTGRDDLLGAIIRSDGDGSFVRLEDVIEEGYFSFRDPFVMTSVNGEDCVTLQIQKHADGNALFIADAVGTLIDELQAAYVPLGISLKVTQDSSTRIEDSMRVLGVNLLLGIVLVCSIIWLFMGFRNAALTTVGIPFAFLVTMVLMFISGNSINEVSLFAFVLVSGIIVDDAIVVVENIHRHHQSGKKLRQAICVGTSEVFLPVVSATLTTIVAFLPMLIMTGMVGDFFAIIPITITFALAASLLECLFILPCHYLDFGRTPQKAVTVPAETETGTGLHGLPGEGVAMTAIRRSFDSAIHFVLRLRVTTLLLMALAFIVAVAIFLASVQGKTNLVRISFFPDNYSLYYVELTAPPSTPLERTHTLVKKVAAHIAAQGGGQAESALGFAGYYIDEDFSPQYGRNHGYVAVTLPAIRDRRFADYPENDVVAHLQEVRHDVMPLLPEDIQVAVRPEKDGPPAGKDLNIRILGLDSDKVAALASEVEDFLRSEKTIAPWLIGLDNDQGSRNRVLRLRVERQKAAELGFSVREIASLAAAVFQGQIIGEMKLADETIDIRLKRQQQGRLPVITALDMVVAESAAGSVRLGDLCRAEYSLEPGFLNRFEGQRAVAVTADIKAGAPVAAAMIIDRVKNLYAGLRHEYTGASLNFAGEHASTAKSFSSLAYAFAIGLIVIYLILAAQFRSSLQPLIIIAAVVFALTGVIWGTILSRSLFTVNSFVAVIGVTGVVVNDSLVLVEFINKCYQSGMERRQALLRATHIRLRPILLTTLTTTLGLLPMALGIPEYSLTWGSMAMTFVTGLCTATFLTLVIIPLLWDMVTPQRTRHTDSQEAA